ncbi:MAG: dicarboxylate/amino acid:cation symporter, partial [Myxococcales bacterium]
MTAPETATRPAAWRIWRWPLHWQILLGLLIGAGIGLAMGSAAVAQIPPDVVPEKRGAAGGQLVRGTLLFEVVLLLGELFLRALFLLIIPLITSSIVLAVARIGGQRDFGRLGLKALAYYFATSLVAILTGLLLVNVVAPGISDGRGILEGHDLGAFAGAQAEVARRVEGRGLSDFLNVFRSMVPKNLFGAAIEENFLGLIVVALFLGYFVTRLVPERRQPFQDLVESVYDLTIMGTELVLKWAPVGVLFLIARTFAEQFATLWPDARFADFLAGISTFALVALTALAFHFLVTMPLILLLVARVNPLRHYR